MKYKTRYNMLLKSGLFWEIYPSLTGDWKEDRDEFIKREKKLEDKWN